MTGSRAEYGLLRWVMEGVVRSPDLRLQLVVTGSHLAPGFGETWREIVGDGFRIDRRVEMLLTSDTACGTTKSMGVAMLGFADAFDQLRPDVTVLLGDRYEILCAAAASLIATIPVAHLHGGEATEGAYDDMLRHAITKLSHLHFVAAEPYRRRVIQMGEDPGRVFLVGGLGVDAAARLAPMERSALESSLGFHFLEKNLLVTFHPVTLDRQSSADQLGELLAALSGIDDTRLIFTSPNADAGGRELRDMILQFVRTHPNAVCVDSMGQHRYLSCLAYVDAVVGNSSSGLAEVPTFRKPTVNVGERQRGRLRAESVIDCPAERDAISAAIREAYTPEFRARLGSVVNPYGDGGASERIVSVLEKYPLEAVMRKAFYDVRSTATHGHDEQAVGLV